VRDSFVGILEHRHIVVLQIKKSGADKPDEPGDGLGRVHLLAVDRDAVPHDPGIVRTPVIAVSHPDASHDPPRTVVALTEVGRYPVRGRSGPVPPSAPTRVAEKLYRSEARTEPIATATAALPKGPVAPLRRTVASGWRFVAVRSEQ
jgi:hypothetical protein